MITSHKTCPVCKVEQTTDNFYFIKKKGFFASECNKCKNIRTAKYQRLHRDVAIKRSRKWAIEHPERIAEMTKKSIEKLKSDPRRVLNKSLMRYKIKVEDYEKMEQEQQNKCAICSRIPSGHYKRLCVDHNHTTGKIRGLLCHHCNFILGFSKENIEVLSNVIKYIKKYETKH